MSQNENETDNEILNQSIKLLEHTSEYQELIVKLKPLVDSILVSGEGRRQARDSLKQLQTRFERSGQRMLLLKEDSKADYDSQLNTLRKAFLFLALFETTVTNILNCLVILLIHNGHDFFVQFKRKCAKNLKDLDESYGVAEKLEFLNLHGFSFLTCTINNSLRNKIAHMDFDIEGKGVIAVKNEKYELQTEVVKLEAVVLLTAKALSNAGFPELLKEEG